MYASTSSKRPRPPQEYQNGPPMKKPYAALPHPQQHQPQMHQNHQPPHQGGPAPYHQAAASSSHRQHSRPDHHKNLAQIVDNAGVNPYAENFAKTISKRMNNPYVNQFKYPYIHDVSCYNKITKIGQGTFGEVFQARCLKSKRFVALKKILMENEREGFPITAIREVKMLQRLKHEHITDLIEVCNSKGASSREKSNFYLVFTYCDYDLAGLLSHQAVKIGLEEVKILMKHLLNGLFKIHKSNILHRDMKAANVLVSNEGVLRLADFGLSRPILKSSSKQNYTNRVVTLWYRPPELLLGSKNYGPQIDIWGAGCIMAELWTRTPILQGDTEQKQLEIIQNVCGGINEEVWPDVKQLPLYRRVDLRPKQPRILREKMSGFTKDEHALNLLDKLLTLDPSQRIDAEKALDDDFFFTDPIPTRTNIKHVVDQLPKNIFEFTAGRGAHANRRPQNHTMQNGNAQNHHRQQPRHRQDDQLTDMVF
ncbi:unnamed protein product [Bursaphelenchus xylophilus]|uniref:(pine wood nematode) hypothetical protein n=1 Tax=Bursaphelenchus xylophilus TaxID=6326 RepID=A0A1I7S810_BURXY|nr:unnamed protein product [Bursaphelenchus xylophilus]CAG9087322.1 unnamed protein product [Bursaphelenchus xylophilus]